MSSLTLGIDVGGTKIAGGVVDTSGTILHRTRADTPSTDPDQIVESILSVAGTLMADYRVDGIGLGCAGFIDAERSRVMAAPNLAWTDVALRERVRTHTGVPTVVENDANAAAWGEFRFGAAAADLDDMVCITLGTGVGGGLVINRSLYRGAFGVGGELGHMVLVPGGLECGCGNRGCTEQYASGTALGRIARNAVLEQPDRATDLLARAGAEPAQIEGSTVTEAAAAGDPLSRELVGEIGTWLGHLLLSVSSLLDPAVYVIGGGVSAAGALLIEPAEVVLLGGLLAGEHRPAPTIRIATLANDAGIVGAADLARV